jgi:hypothetical protein
MRLTSICILTLAMLLTACSTTVPVKRNFPDAPLELKEKCVELNQLPTETQKLSEVLTSVTKNYSEYHLCKNKTDMWIEWYNTQKQIFDEVK